MKKSLSAVLCLGLLLIFQAEYTKANKFYDKFIADHDVEIKRRIYELRKILVPLPEDQFQDILEKTARRYIPVQAKSDECRNHSNHLLKSFLDGDMWALRMLDAGSKLVSGVLDGHFEDLGNYEQCISITEPDHLFKGQHCVVQTLGLPPKPVKGDARFPKSVTMSVCVPSSCSLEDVAFNMDLTLAELNASTVYSAMKFSGQTPLKSVLSCSTADPLPLSLKNYIGLAIFGVLAVVLACCTLLESKYGLSEFSLKKNFDCLMNTSPSPSEISCMNGIRVFFILMLVMYHRAATTFLGLPSARFLTVLDALDSYTWGFLEFMNKGLDAFFMIGGTVLSYSFFRERLKHQRFNILNHCLHRYFRMMPLVATLMLFYVTLVEHISRGPLWMGLTQDLFEAPCINYWWHGLLQIGNYYTPGSMCVGQSWYVNCDFQLNLLAPLVLIPLHKKPRVGMLLMGVCFLVPVLASTVKSYVNKQYAGGLYNAYFANHETFELSDWDYRGFHFRAPGFVMGLALGYSLFTIKQNRDSVKLSKPFFLLGWILTGTLLAAVYFASVTVNSTTHEYNIWVDTLFNCLSMPVYCCCFAYIIFACSVGYGGIVNQVLSWGGFRPLAKLTFGVFLIHEVVVAKNIFSVQVPVAFNFGDYFFLVCGDVVFSFAAACVAYLFVEIPCAKLASKLLKGKIGNEQLEKQKQIMTELTISTDPNINQKR